MMYLMNRLKESVCFSIGNMRKGLAILALIFLFSCIEEEVVVYPDHLIPQEQMVEITVDMFLVEAAFKHHIMIDDPKRRLGISYQRFHEVFLTHGITQEQYAETMDWYKKKENIDALQMLYEKAIEDINRRKDEV